MLHSFLFSLSRFFRCHIQHQTRLYQHKYTTTKSFEQQHKLLWTWNPDRLIKQWTFQRNICQEKPNNTIISKSKRDRYRLKGNSKKKRKLWWNLVVIYDYQRSTILIWNVCSLDPFHDLVHRNSTFGMSFSVSSESCKVRFKIALPFLTSFALILRWFKISNKFKLVVALISFCESFVKLVGVCDIECCRFCCFKILFQSFVEIAF